MTPLATRIKAERDRLGLVQTEVAHQAGITPANYIRIESGQSNPKASTLLALVAIGFDLGPVFTPPRKKEREGT